jgi:hypothetical protein
MPSDTAIYVYVTVSVSIIGLLMILLYRCSKKSCQHYTDKPRDMCLCNGMGGKMCANKQELEDSYNKGNTEYQNFNQIQKNSGGPLWKNTDFSCY